MGNCSTKSYDPNKADAKTPNAPVSSKTVDSEYIEAAVCYDHEMKDNEMKVFEIGEEGKVLVVKQKGEFTAVGTKCTHYGAPLITGALGEGRIRCPWHGACFNLKTGDIEDFPGFDSLPCYQVNVTPKGEVRVRARIQDLKENRRVTSVAMTGPCTDSSTYVIIGGGPSGATCAETLRAEGFKGRVVVVARENCLPYDRIKVSKLGTVTDFSKIQVRSADYYKTANIEMLIGVNAIKVDVGSRSVHLSNGERIDFTALYLATGSKPRVPDIPGVNLKNIFTVRNYSDSEAILQAVGTKKDKHVVVLGLSFIGLECAASLIDKAAHITCVGNDKLPLSHVFGNEIGNIIYKLFDKNAHLIFEFETTVVKCNGKDGVIESVELANGKVLKADVFIMGVGATAYTEFLEGSGINLEGNGTVTVDDKLETNINAIYAGGDIANAPVHSHGNVKASIGHIGLAQYHGKVAALNMMGNATPLRAVPCFWTMLFGKSIRYSGYGKHTSIQIEGNLDEWKFVIFFFNENDKVISVASCGRDPIVMQFAEMLYQGKALYKKDLQINPFYWVDSIHEA